MQTRIRRAHEADLPAILSIINEEIEHSTLVYDERLRTLEEQTHWFKLKQEQGFPVLVIESSGKVAGYASYGRFRPFDGYRFTAEHSLYIDKDYRGKGMGNLLMTELIGLAKSEGYHVLVAGIDSTNLSSIQFHEKFGFEQVGEMKEVGFKFNRWLDLVFLQLKLQSV